MAWNENAPLTAYQCPDTAIDVAPGETLILGCGHLFSSKTDDEGLVDCPHCGIWFNPVKEPDTIINIT